LAGTGALLRLITAHVLLLDAGGIEPVTGIVDELHEINKKEKKKSRSTKLDGDKITPHKIAPSQNLAVTISRRTQLYKLT
jgi:hypothetical protein